MKDNVRVQALLLSRYLYGDTTNFALRQTDARVLNLMPQLQYIDI